ncbi:MAG: DUF4350 domain-containing protein [Deltaproteobacteria bacterium]|nr:DUF4350 domain-containing protein [Deltaproteobacteria bacterium]
MSGRRRALSGLRMLLLLWLGIPLSAAASTSISRDGDGKLIFYLLLEDLGYQVQRSSDIDRLDANHDLVIVLGESDLLKSQRIESWLKQGKALLYAPPLFVDEHCARVDFAGLQLERSGKAAFSPAAKGFNKPINLRSAMCAIDLKKGDNMVVGKDQRGLAVERAHGRGLALLLAHQGLVVNASVGDDDLIVAVRRWIGAAVPPRGRILFIDDRQAGKLTELLKKANLVPLVLHGLLALFLLYWLLTPRFGESDPEPSPIRRRFAQHAEALGNLYLRAGSSRHALAAFYQRVCEKLAGRLSGTERGQQRVQLARLIATRSGRNVDSVDSLLAQIEYAIGESSLPDAREIQRHFRLCQALAELERHSAVADGRKKNR